MPHTFIREPVDIDAYPVVLPPTKDVEISLGDLHGNAVKLLFMLLKHGIATNMDKAQYGKIVEIYKTPIERLTKEDLTQFERILSQIKFSGHALVRLIGDELADRGSNDYFTLKIIEKLHENGIGLEILVSNHSAEFIQSYEKTESFKQGQMDTPFIQSMINLGELVEKKLVDLSDVLTLIETAYKPNLRAVAYSLNANQDEITIYSHACIGLDTIEKLAQKFRVPYKDGTAKELALTINAVNKQFAGYVKSNLVGSLYTSYEARAVSARRWRQGTGADNPFVHLIWNAEHDIVNRPASYKGYNIFFVHGHDSADAGLAHVFNLDNQLGKSPRFSRADYTVLSVARLPPSFSLSLEEGLHEVNAGKSQRDYSNVYTESPLPLMPFSPSLERGLYETHILMRLASNLTHYGLASNALDLSMENPAIQDETGQIFFFSPLIPEGELNYWSSKLTDAQLSLVLNFVNLDPKNLFISLHRLSLHSFDLANRLGGILIKQFDKRFSINYIEYFLEIFKQDQNEFQNWFFDLNILSGQESRGEIQSTRDAIPIILAKLRVIQALAEQSSTRQSFFNPDTKLLLRSAVSELHDALAYMPAMREKITQTLPPGTALESGVYPTSDKTPPSTAT